MKSQHFSGWIGFGDGEPFWWIDYPGAAQVLEVYRTKGEALKVYEDVREVTILVKEKE